MDIYRCLKMTLNTSSRADEIQDDVEKKWKNQGKFDYYRKCFQDPNHRNVHEDIDDYYSESIRKSRCVGHTSYNKQEIPRLEGILNELQDTKLKFNRP